MMPGSNNDPCLRNDATMTTPLSRDADEAIFNSSTSATSTTPTTKPHLFQHRHNRKGKMYDPTKDLLDALPPEILDQILLSFDKTTLLQCVTLSRRWARRVMPHLWYSPRMLYYASWMRLYQTMSVAATHSVKGGGGGGEGGCGVGDMVVENSHHDGLGLQQQEDKKEGEQDHAVAVAAAATAAGGGAMAITTRTRSMVANHSQHHHQLSQHPPLRFPYGALVKTLNFSNLYYILSDTFLAHLLPLTPLLTTLIIDAPKQFSDDALLTLAKKCPLLERLELWGCGKVSDTGMEAVARECWRLRVVVLSNVVRSEGEGEWEGGGGGGGVGNSSRASMSNHGLTLTHKTLDYLAITSPPPPPPPPADKDDEASIRTLKTMTGPKQQRKLYTLNLANGLRFPSSEPTASEPSPSSLSLTALLKIHSNHLTTVNLSFCGPAVSDSTLAHLSISLKHLNIAFCYEVTDASLTSLAQNSPDLQDLDITGVTQVTDKGVLEIGYGCKELRRLVMVDERYRSNAGGAVGSEGGGQWSTQNPLITDEVLSLFPWGARIIQRRDELLGQKKPPRIF